MEIIVLSKPDAAKFVCQKPWAAVSISTEPWNWPQLSQKNLVDSIQLAFHDRSDPLWLNHPIYGETYFSVEQAHQILDFVENVKDKIELLLVHCEKGQSRSAAIAGALKVIWGEDNKEFFVLPFIPNMFVYNVMLNAHRKIIDWTWLKDL